MQLDKLTLKSQEALQEAQRFLCKHLSLIVLGRRANRILMAALVVINSVLLTSCTTAGKPPQSELEAIKIGHKSIVLFRVTASMGTAGQSVRTGIPFKVGMGQLDQTEYFETLHSRADFSKWIAPSVVAGKQGWRYLVLDPGAYYVELRPELPAVEINTNEVCSLYVPAGKSIVYAGSFCFDKRVIKKGFWGTLNNLGQKRYEIKSLGIRDETAEARQVARECLAEFGDVTPCPAISYDNLSAAAVNVTNRNIAKVESVYGSPFATDDVGADRTVIASAPFLAPGAFALAASQSTPWDTEKDKEQEKTSEVVGIWLLLAASPFAIAADKTIGEATRKKWAPYAAAMEKEFIRFDLDRHLTDEVGNRLSALHPAVVNSSNAPTDSTCILRLEPYRVFLRETRYKKFALEIAVLVQLFGPSSKTVLWQHDYVYSDFEAAQKNTFFLPVPYETLVQTASAPHELDEYKGDQGLELFRTGLTNAVNGLSSAIATRFQEAGFSK
ncbi:MAG: hypothetical protein ABSD57_10625 [Verrucomicrobiota bacterium]|jgi:hypothetical protein